MDSKSQSGTQESVAKHLTKQELSKYKDLLRQAFTAAHDFTGSEKSEHKLLKPLILVDLFVQARNSGDTSVNIETAYAKAALSDNSEKIPYTVDEILEEAEVVYSKMRDAGSHDDILELLQNGGALVKQSDTVFVQTDDGEINLGASDTTSKFEVKTQPRLAMLVTRLRNEGIYTDDLIIHAGVVDPEMVRSIPYHVVQIPRLDKEIAVCDQVGEITFVKNAIIGSDLWANLSKDRLKERSDIQTVRFTNEDQWWSGIKSAISEDSLNTKLEISPKVDLVKYAGKKPPLDIDLIKQSLLAHKEATGEWLTAHKKGTNGKKGSYVLEHGSLADQITVGALDSNLAKGFRSLLGGSSIVKLNEELAKQNNLIFVNNLNRKDLDPELMKDSLLAHYKATGNWLRNHMVGTNGKKGSYVLEHGHYAGQLVSVLQGALSKGLRGLPVGSSIAQINEEISDQNGLDYINKQNQENLDLDLIKESLLEHRQVTGEWLSSSKKEATGKKGSYVLEYGYYARKMTANTLENSLYRGSRGLLGSSSIAQLNEEISAENDLDYINIQNQKDLDVKLIKESLLEHYHITGEWLSKATTGIDGKSYVLEHGSYTGQITVSALNSAMFKGARGLGGGSSIAKITQEIIAEEQIDQMPDDDIAPQPV